MTFSRPKRLPPPPPDLSSLSQSDDSPVISDGIVSTLAGVGGGINTLSGASLWSNPVVETAVRTLEQLSDIGAAMPFVAPAFVIVKFIIDVEKAARDADAKCNDLLERITFMLSQLNVLRTVQVNEATQRVIERMNDILKTAGSLIQAYRKQSVVSRRLHTGNKEKFASCVDSIATCCTDLMISLQIHQTTQLEVLTRAVPVDPGDESAEKFLAEHGGADGVRADPKLVKQFASEMHLKIDEDAIEQLNTNFTQLMQASQAQLEGALTQTVSDAVVEGIKGLATQMNEAEKEQVFKCVQCDQDYRNSRNGPTSCSFHRGEYSSWSSSYPCCDTSHPCQFQFHRSAHHCDYPYGSFFERARNITNYIDTVSEWVSVEDTNLENDNCSRASIGQLLRWVSRGSLLTERTILIRVGSIWFSEPYFFDTFTADRLDQASKVAGITKKTTIFRTSPSKSEYAMAEWVLSPKGTITGVRLTAKAATSALPCVRICPIDITGVTKSGEIVAVSDGGLRSYTPASPYVLPATIRVTPELNDKTPRATRTDFKTRTSPSLPVILKVVSDPPLKANKFAHHEWDNFDGTISVFNKHPAGSQNPITIASISASFRLIGDSKYTPVKSIKVVDSQLPVTIEPRQSSALNFQVVVPRSEEDTKLGIKWWDRAFVARHRPLRLKIVLQDMDEEEASLVLEYIFPPYQLEKPKETDLAFFSFDDQAVWERRSVRVTKPSSDNIISFESTEIEEKRLKKVIYTALQTGETEVDLGIGQVKGSGDWEWNVWALVDVASQNVYALKVLLKQGSQANNKMYGCLGYVLCPPLQDTVSEVRPVKYAVERVQLPDLEPFTVQKWEMEDDVDDVVAPQVQPPVLNAGPAGTGLSDAQMAISDGLHQPLFSIDTNLHRIATAVEKLVEILGKGNVSV